MLFPGGVTVNPSDQREYRSRTGGDIVGISERRLRGQIPHEPVIDSAVVVHSRSRPAPPSFHPSMASRQRNPRREVVAIRGYQALRKRLA